MPPKIEKEVNIDDLNIKEHEFGLVEEEKIPEVDVPIENRIQEKIRNFDILDKDLNKFTFMLPGASAATAANYGIKIPIFQPIEIICISEIHTTAASGSINLDVRDKDGNSLLATSLSLSASANIVYNRYGASLTATAKYRRMFNGDYIKFVVGGTPTNCTDVTVLIWYKFLSQGNYRTYA